ncbi:flagellar biosynthesis chaperone FliJ [Bacillus timonensis]|nr:flagellar biosynthesis chaperone FliJ [Bacillus timonensis]
MSYQPKFTKLLTIRENEKNQVLADYNEAVKEFELVAEKLYSSLKKKEDLEDVQKSKLSHGLSINDIRHHQKFITSLEKTIMHHQKLVIQARNKMYMLQEKLIEKNIEVKKYEKMNERDLNAFKQLVQANEANVMNEVSIQQYMKRTN